MEDEKILDLFFSRSELAIFETQRKYGKFCFLIANGILNCKEDAEECVNDTYVRAWESIPPHRPECLSAFLGRITRNLSLDRYRKMNAEKRGKSPVALPLEELEECLPDASAQPRTDSILLQSAINSFLRTLPTEARIIFMQRYWYFCAVKEISVRLKISERKVKMSLLRTRNRLKKYLEKEGISI